MYKYKKQVVRKGIVVRPKFPRLLQLSQGRPVLFAALGSHGLWTAPGDQYFVTVPKLIDKNGYGTLWKTWENIEILNNNNPPTWTDFRGKWGNPKSKCFLFKKLGFCELIDGPLGILKRKKDFSC